MERLELAEWFNKLIGSEINAMLQYEIAASIAENKDAKDEFNQHANEERVHMKKLLKYANKIKLNLDQNLKTLVKNAYPEYENMNYKDDNNLLKFHIRGEQGAIKSYKEFLKEIKFSKMHVFKYSPRKGTKAAEFKNQIDGNTKNKRSDILIKLSEENEEDFAKTYIGKEIEVLFENENEGHTKNYIKVESNEKIKNAPIIKKVMVREYKDGALKV